MAAETVLAIARAEIGIKENPKGSNKVKYNTWYYGREVSGDSYPWCMAFVQWVMSRAGVTVPVRTASCGALMRAAKKAGQWVTEGYQPGDVVIYDLPRGAATDHTGLCESVTATTITCIEGNTSVSDASNGGEVRRMTRKLSLVVGAWRPQYSAENDNDKEDDDVARYNKLTDIPDKNNFRAIVDDLMTAGIIGGDGSDPDGNDDVIDLSHDMVRMLIFNYRAGVYDEAIRAAGLDPDRYK